MWTKTAGLLGNGIILLTFLRVMIGITVVAQNILWGMGAVAIMIGLVVYWESKVPTAGVSRLKRGGLVFLSTLLIDLVAYTVLG